MSIIDKPIVKTLMLKGEKGDPGDLDSTAIVDNLTTNRADKVLSAKQGKVLKDLVDANKIVSDHDIINLNSALDLKANTADVASEYATKESVNDNISSLDAKVNSLASGSPLIASSISGMTDTTRIYVNTTDGHWYWYNGTQWIDGGVYQATEIEFDNKMIQGQNIKEKLTPKSNNYDHFEYFDVTFENGDVGKNNTTGKIQFTGAGRATRIRVAQSTPITITENTLVVALNDCYIWLYVVDAEDNVTYSSGTWKRKDVLPYTANTRCYIAIRQNDANANITPLEGKLNARIPVGIYVDLPLIIKNSSDEQINVDTTNKTITFPSDCVFIWKDKYYILDSQKVVSISNTSSALKLYLNIDTGAITSYGYSQTPAGQLLVGVLRFIQGTNKFVSFIINAPYTIDGNFFNSFQIKDLRKINSYTVNTNTNYIRSVAHQGYTESGSYNYCKLEGYQKAKDHGFDYGELDLRTTSDGVLVCSHDDTFTSNGETITISTSTYNDIKDLDYHGGKIATFESVISLCKQIGLGVYIDHLYTLDSTGWNTMFSIIRKYQMQDNVVYLCDASQTEITNVLNFYYKSKIAMVTSSTNFTNIINLINSNKTNFNKFSIDLTYTNMSVDAIQTLVASLPTDVDVEVWTIDNLNICKQYLPYVSGITSNKISILDMQKDM